MLTLEDRAELQTAILGLDSQALQSIAACPLAQSNELAELDHVDLQPDPRRRRSKPCPNPSGETFVRG
jgi:hypothetical protein